MFNCLWPTLFCEAVYRLLLLLWSLFQYHSSLIIEVFSPTQKQPSPHVISSVMGMLTKNAITRCLAVCRPCSVLNCVNIHCLTNPLLSHIWFPLALFVVSLTPLLRLNIWDCFVAILLWFSWMDTKDGGVTITTIVYWGIKSSGIIWIQVERWTTVQDTVTHRKMKKKVKMHWGGKGWNPLADLIKKLTLYDWVE